MLNSSHDYILKVLVIHFISNKYASHIIHIFCGEQQHHCSESPITISAFVVL